MRRNDTSFGRRFFLPVGASCPGGAFRSLAGVPGDLARMGRLFARLGYVPVPFPVNPSAAQLRNCLADWLARADLGGSDAVVAYYSGHGVVVGGDHYLVTDGFDRDQAGATGLKTEEILELVLRRRARPGKVLLILDCCQAGSVMTEGLRRVIFGQDSGVFVLAASGSWGQAVDGAFSAAFNEVVSPTTRRARRITRTPSLDQIAEALNAKGLASRVVQAGVSSSRFDLLDGGMAA